MKTQEPSANEEWDRLIEQLIKAVIQMMEDFKRMLWGDQEMSTENDNDQSS